MSFMTAISHFGRARAATETSIATTDVARMAGGSELGAADPGSREPGLASSPDYQSAWFDQPDTATWFPSRNSADASILPAKDMTLARVRDVIRNDPVAGAALERLLDMVVGHGLHLVARPDAQALGITADQAHAVSRQIQSEWRLFANDPRHFCDATRKATMNGLFRLLARTWLTADECCYALTATDDPLARYRTAVLPIDPDRLSNPNGSIETMTLRGGVEMNEMGAPVAYHVRNAHATDWWAFGLNFTWTRVPRETEWGRPVFVHAFEPEREGQTRGMSPFASIVRTLSMRHKHASAEIAAAVANATYAAFVESDLPVDEVTQRLTPQSTSFFDKVVTYFTKNPARINGVRIPVMPPGSKITMNGTPRQTTAFVAFETAFLQKIAARLGISYEQMAMDWTKTNYSSARAALTEVWRHIRRVVATFNEQVVSPIYYAFLEEAIDTGRVKLPASAPAFHAMPAAWLRARWIAPGRGYIDPVKEAEAAALRMESLISTLEIECAEQGHDYEDILDQIERENAELAKRKLSRLSIVAAVQANKGAKPDSEEATGPAGPGGDDKEGSK